MGFFSADQTSRSRDCYFPSRARSSVALVTGAEQLEFSQTYAVGLPSIAVFPCSKGEISESDAPELTV